MRGRGVLAGLIAAGSALLAGCAHDGTTRSSTSSDVALVSLALDQTTVTAGATISGTATVRNDTGKPISVPSPSCDGWPLVGLTSHTGKFTANSDLMLCPPNAVVPVGVSRYPITVRTTYNRCTQTPSQATTDMPACIGPAVNQMPPLPAGTYQTVAWVPAPLKAGKPLTVRLTRSSR